MKKPTKKIVKEMSTTPKGAKKASILKWEWLLQASAKQLIDKQEPYCGLCVYYRLTMWHNCDKKCPLKPRKYYHCGCCVQYKDAIEAWDDLEKGDGTLKQFRAKAKKMLNRIKAITF